MGRAERPRPARLGEKLLQIRQTLNLSQNELLRALGMENGNQREDISKFELDRREPSSLLLLRYARLVNVYVDVLIDDSLDLPRRLPSSQKHAGVQVRKKKKVVAAKKNPGK